MKDSTTNAKLFRLASIFLLFCVWQGASMWMGAEILLPSPVATLQRLVALTGTRLFWVSVAATLQRGLTGFALSLCVGLVLGLVAGFKSSLRTLLEPFVLTTRSTPLMSIILLALIWFRADTVPIFVAFLVCFPVIFSNVLEGVKNVDQSLVEMAAVFKVGFWSRVIGLYLPSIAPYILAGASTAMGLGLKVVVAAEALSQPRQAIGTRMQVERMYLETTGVFAWTVAALAMSWVLELVIRHLAQHFMRGGRKA